MANAFVYNVEPGGFTADGNMKFFCDVAFVGSDVGGGRTTSLEVLCAQSDSAATISTKIAAAVRAYATANGFTVPTNTVFMSSYTKG